MFLKLLNTHNDNLWYRMDYYGMLLLLIAEVYIGEYRKS